MSSEDLSLPPRKRIKMSYDDIVKPGDVDIASPIVNIKTEVENVDEDSNPASCQLDDLPENSVNTSQYNSVTMEELQKLKEFQVLDEVNEEDSKDEDSDVSDKSDGELDEDEIEKMLEEDLPEGFKGVPKPRQKSYVTRQKNVLEEKGINHFEVLPLDWMMVRHCSGMPVYMHRSTRVCTLSKPYFLGKGNTRRHEIPISAVPCLAYRKALEEEEKQKVIDRSIAEQIANGTWANDQPSVQAANKSDDPNANQPTHQAANKLDDPNASQPTYQAANKSGDPNADQQYVQAAIKSDDTDAYQPNVQAANQPGDTNAEQPNVPSDPSETEETDLMSEKEEKYNILKLHIDPTLQSNDSNTYVDDKVITMEQLNNAPSDTNNQPTCPMDRDSASRKPVVLPGGIVMPPPRVESVNTSWKTQHLTSEQLNDYCKQLFKFKTVNIMHFKRWADRRKYVKARKTLQYPTLPEGTKLITIPAQNRSGPENNGKSTKRDWVMNMNGCSYLSVFHEYVRRALQKQPVYEFKQLENAATPYQATVYIGGMQYGVGHGSSKRQAKSAAAKASIHILIPEMKDDLDEHTRQMPGQDPLPPGEPDFSFFDYVCIEDPRITEFCAATSEPSPHAILRTCLLRNFGTGDRHINTEMKKLEYQKMELTMTVGKHSATVVCKNKKQAKQRASQAILQALHPHITSWGSLLRLYGSRSVKSCKEKKLEEQQITLLQDKAQQNEPNYAVLDKLRHEMRRLRARDAALAPIGTLLVPEGLPTHSGSMLNNVDL